MCSNVWDRYDFINAYERSLMLTKAFILEIKHSQKTVIL